MIVGTKSAGVGKAARGCGSGWSYEWAHLVLGGDPVRKRLMWAWLERGRGVDLAEVLRRWRGQGAVGLVWDNAAFHQSKAVGDSRPIHLR